MSRLIRVMGLVFVAALVFGAVSVAGASAAPEWQLNGVSVTEWMKVDSTATLELEDSKATLPTTVKCSGVDTGDVGPEGKDKILTITVTGQCTSVKGGCSSDILASAENLPWNTQLVEVENKNKEKEVRDKIESGGSGEPGWKVNCKNILGGAEEDVCLKETGVEASVGIDNITSGAHKGDVAALFDAISHERPAKCTKGGAKSGFVSGVDFILTSNGAKLTASGAKAIEL